ncbi:unnamed protein product [Psylliodes chrysocephalus]|uniref:HAT C-terminal dimerisation domain-containing protein n=1 Tax=Psylliodes chrysocephalus TaxID=3402493 RepID=A0A9P0D2V5_9CUCU|nr:unnamed protein product [Psylliodes chrysocephala]
MQKIVVSNKLSQMFKTELEKQIEKRLIPLEKNTLLAASTMVDPRFKKLHFCSPINAANAIAHLKKEILQELKLEDQRTVNLDNDLLTASDENVVNDIWQIHDEAVATARKSIESGNSGTNFPTELKLYLDQPLINRKIDPIQYWRENESAFPATSKVAFKYLTILGAFVPSERLVSLLNLICTDHRSRLTPSHTNQLVFLGSLDEEYWNM